MADGVKFIFKTIFKIPVIILVCYAIFNVFAFSLSYFRLLGVSYVVMQTAMENNYIPPQENATIRAYMNTLQTDMLLNPTFTVNTESGGNTRGQYGERITITVSGRYRFVWPLRPDEQRANGIAASGWNDGYGDTGGMLSDAALDELRDDRADATEWAPDGRPNIMITYVVPGLKYYADKGNTVS